MCNISTKPGHFQAKIYETATKCPMVPSVLCKIAESLILSGFLRIIHRTMVGNRFR